MARKKIDQKYVVGAIDAAIAILFLLLLVISMPLVKGYFDDREFNDVLDISKACSSLNIIESTECATKITKSFYKYNIDNLGKELDFQTLKKDGGVCTSWSDYYNEIGQNLGYNTENVIIKISDDLSHEFNVWSNENQYCIIDQTESICIGF